MPAVTFVFTIVGYLGSAVLFYLALLRSPDASSLLAWARRTLSFTVAVHLGDIILRSVVFEACPVLSAAFALSLAALSATIAFLIWARQRRVLSLGAIVAPIALGMFVASEVLTTGSSVAEVPGWFLALHVLLNLIAVALLVFGAAAAIAYLMQVGRLKAKRPGAAFAAFPGLSSLESIIERSLILGLGPMTLGVVSGAVFAERLSRGEIELARMSLAYTCWLTVACLLLGQRLIGWNGRKLAWGAVFAALLALAVVVLYGFSDGAVGGHA